MARERDRALSAANVFYMLLVVFIHVAAECVSGYIVGSVPFFLAAAAHRIASVAVQGFLFLAGLRFSLSRREDFSLPAYYGSRLKRLVLPYLIAFAAFYAVYALRGRIEAPSPSHALGEFFTGGLTSHFYFVAIIAQFTILAPLWIMLEKRASPALTLFVSLFVTLICMDHMPEFISLATSSRIWFTKNGRLFTSYLFYWIAGNAAGRNYAGFTEFLAKRRRSLAVLWLICAAADCAVFIGIKTGTYYAIWADDFHLLVSTLAVLAVLAFAQKHRDLPLFRAPLFSSADRASYLVYLWHPMVILFVDALLNRLGIASLTARFLVRFALTAPVSIAVCALWQRMTGLFRNRKEAL